MTQQTAIVNLKNYLTRFNNNQRAGYWITNNGDVFIKVFSAKPYNSRYKFFVSLNGEINNISNGKQR